MHLWRQTFVLLFPRAQLLGQHRGCAALRGAGWGGPYTTVNYVFTYSPDKLYLYHVLIMEEVEKRGYRLDPLWKDPLYRGKTVVPYPAHDTEVADSPIYPEHDGAYLDECLENLRNKGIVSQIVSDSLMVSLVRPSENNPTTATFKQPRQ